METLAFIADIATVVSAVVVVVQLVLTIIQLSSSKKNRL